MEHIVSIYILIKLMARCTLKEIVMDAEYIRIVQEIKSKTENNELNINKLENRISKQEARSETLYQMSENIALMAQSLKQVEGDVGEVKITQKELSEKVSTLENQPAKDMVTRITSVRWGIISAVCGAAAVGLFWILVAQLNK